MADFHISVRFGIEDELQYLREGLFKQLTVMILLRSGGGCKLFRSSISDAEWTSKALFKMWETKRRRFTVTKAM